jgi:chromosome partitioning protein
MNPGWVVCSVCAKPFAPRFSYQTLAAGEGSTPRYFCSQACRMPELRAGEAVATGVQASLHSCASCGVDFQLRFAYQVVNVDRQRRVVCSEACKAALAAPPTGQPRPRLPRAIAVMNQKGGTGKTTTSVSLAAGLAERGHATLLVDLDAQGSVAVSLGIVGPKTLYHVLIDGVAPMDAAVPVRKGLDVICSDQTVAAAELELVNAKDRARVLSRRLAPTLGADSPYEYVILDCAPSLSLLNQNALTFAQEVVVPVSCDYLSLVGVKQILRTLRHVNEVLLHPVEVLGVLPTFYDVRNKISREAVEALSGYFKNRVLPPIRVNAKLKEAPSHKQTIFEYAPESHGALDYAAVAYWISRSTPPATAATATATATAAATAKALASPSATVRARGRSHA